MASWQGASAGADVCPICLERLSSETVSLGCGHLLHLNCLSGLSQCPMCRGPIDPDRIKLAGAVPAAAGPAGGFVGYAVRSAAPQRPPPTGGAGAGAAGQQHPIPAPAATRLDASDAPAATDIPPAYRDLLLFGIMRQLGAAADASHGLPAQAPAARAYVPYGMGLLGPFNAAPAAGAHAGQPMAPNTWAFCIDVSSSMGSSRAWQPNACSRLCFALASLACMVDSRVAQGDWVLVAAFDAGLATIKRWFRKPASFDKAAFLAELTGAVRYCGLERYGTNLCTAACQVIADLATRASLVAGTSSHGSGAGGGSDGAPPVAAEGGPAAGGGRACSAAAAGRVAGRQEQQHSFVLLTDGESADEATAFELAQALMREPPFPDGGFRALLIHIASQPGSSSCLQRLSRDVLRIRLAHVSVLELQLGASLNFSLPPPSAAAAAPGQAQQAADWQPVRVMSAAINHFSSMGGSAPSRRPESAQPPQANLNELLQQLRPYHF